jgi:transposase
VSNQSGTGGGHPSQDKALLKTRREVKQLEEALRQESAEKEKLRKENERLKQEIEKLKKELAAIRRPPKWVKPNRSDEGKKKPKKKGPKNGHSPNRRTMPQSIDREMALVPKHCPDCQGNLPEPSKWHTHTQIDLPPPPKPIVTQYHVGWAYCKNCQKEVSIRNRLSGSKYGPNLHAQVCYWKFSLGLTLGKIRCLLRNQYGLDLSTGLLSEMITRSAKRFEGAYEDLGTSLLGQTCLYGDETGWRNDGDNAWLWSFSNQDVSYYVIDRSRGQKVVEDVLGKSFNGVLVSDFYGGYNRIACVKQKCWTHLLRDFRELKKKYPKSAEIKTYSKHMKRFFRRGLSLQEAHRAGKNIEKRFRRLEGEVLRFIFKRPRHPELKRLMKRLRKYRNDLYVFVRSGVDATNNAAEREIRPAVLMRKISYGNRSDQGVQNQAILMSMIRTAAKRGQSFTQMAATHFCS